MTEHAEYTNEEIGFTAQTIDDISDFLTPDGPEDTTLITDSPNEPVTDLIDEKPQTVKSRRYQKKAQVPLRAAFKYSMQRQDTLPDAAAILLYAPSITRAVGDLADADEKFAHAIDWLTEGMENPYLNAVTAFAPFALQMIRNHEPSGETVHHGIPIPFSKGKRIFTKLKFRIKLGWVRHATDDPIAITNYVFSRPNIIEALSKQGVHIGTTGATTESAPKTAPRKRAPRKATPKK